MEFGAHLPLIGFTEKPFCLEHSEEITRLMSGRLVQTNVLRRCACLIPAFGLVAQQLEVTPRPWLWWRSVPVLG